MARLRHALAQAMDGRMSEATDFEKGALWALQLLRRLHDERRDLYRKVQTDLNSGDLYGLMNAAQNIEVGMLQRFEGRFVREIRDAVAEAESEAAKVAPRLTTREIDLV